MTRFARISILPFLFLILNYFAHSQTNSLAETINIMLKQKDNFFYIDAENYPQNMHELPIGIFDSGTGGLTVFNSIITMDMFNNEEHSAGKDGIKDFDTESFIYLGDMANMPYGNYSKENKNELLKEHILKDVQFLLSNKYYPSAHSTQYNTDKLPVKSIVIACNTATAYGMDVINTFMEKSGLPVKVIGVIDAGVKGALDALENEDSGIIGVLATAGTVKSKGYEKTIHKIAENQSLKTDIEVFSQGGIGIAGAIDGDKQYYDPNAKDSIVGYKGPKLNGKNGIDKTLLDYYNFDFTGGKMICDSDRIDDCNLMQINDPVNYMRFHLTSLMEKIRKSKSDKKLKVIILGCTHYPYLTQEIEEILNELYHTKTKDGKYRYQPNMLENIGLIDPAINTAIQLYDHLKQEAIFSVQNNYLDSDVYISVPNRNNLNNTIDASGKFPYEYKYGRTAGELQQYVKRIPFNFEIIDHITLQRIHDQLPVIYSIIEN